MPAEISGGHLFPVPRFVKGELAAERHRDLIAQALNEAASSAFCPAMVSDHVATSQDISGATLTTVTGLSLDVLSPLTAFCAVVASMVAQPLVYTVGNGELELRISENGVAKTSAIWDPRDADAIDTLTWLYVGSDLRPATVYTYTVEARVKPTGTGANTYRLNVNASAEESTLAALLLPRRP